MLTQLAIHRIGVIDEAVLDFGPGFTALTGETGAGKTMVITGLGLLMGARLDSRRAGLSSMVEGRVDAQSSRTLTQALDELGAEGEDGEVLIVRRVTKDGRSRAHIGGVPVPVSTLAELVGNDITIHGQSDQLRLKDADQQRDALDSVLEHDAHSTATQHAQTYKARERLLEEQRTLQQQLDGRDSRKAELTSILERIDAADTFEGEDDSLKQEIEQLSTSAEELDALDATLMALVGDEQGSVLAALDSAAAAVGRMPSTPDTADEDLVNRVLALREEVSEIAREISLRRDDSLASPGRLEEAQERLHELTTLVRDLGPKLDGASNVTELLARSRKAVETLDALEGGAQRLEQLNREISEHTAALEASAELLTNARVAAATRLAAAIEKELAGLEMPGARVRIEVTPAAMSAHGTDAVQFEMQPHPGAKFMPVSTGASGGELSRVMLALEVSIARLGTLAHGGTYPVFIFDEIDAGIGGRAARAVGQRLAELATSAQVVVVTHLPQVAAYAQTHLHIEKNTDDGETRSRVRPLTGDARVKELARMLAGDDTSDTALEHARELLDATLGMKAKRA